MVQLADHYVANEYLDAAVSVTDHCFVCHLRDGHDDLVEVAVGVHHRLTVVADIESHQEVMFMIPDTGQQSSAVVSRHGQREHWSLQTTLDA